MCGISGILHFNQHPVSREVLSKINSKITHRGPDDEGFYLNGPIGLAHRRLSIIDLSSGHQPMTSTDGRYTIVFNGEIYNYQSLKVNLEKTGFIFTTQSDTEVLLNLFIRDGVDSLAQVNGMFAYAIWDKQKRELFVARDRMGKKPLYYWQGVNQFVFASEPKAILAHPDFIRRLNKEAVAHFFQYEYVPAPMSIYAGINKLRQGHYLLVKDNLMSTHQYWDVPFSNQKIDASEFEIAANLIGLLDQATACRLMSDVPLGVFLSGGIDSSAVVALMARHREGRDIKTFSIGFEEASYDESAYAALIAKKFGTDHHHEVLSAGKMLEILPRVTAFMDEPFADYSILPTYLLSGFARKSVTVALGGDGGDELFAGYPTFQANHYAALFQKLPKIIQMVIRAVVYRLPVSLKDMSFDFKAKQFLYGADFPTQVRNQVWLGAFHHEEMKLLFADTAYLPYDPLKLVEETLKNFPSGALGDLISYFYQKFYLCDDILVKTDRASMAHSLEVRAPFLDVNVVEFAANIPFAFKLKKGQGKAILKKALEGILPDEIIYRSKKGFGIPMAQWLREDLKSKMIATLSVARIKKDGIFNAAYIQNLINDHLSGRRNNRKQLFALLMFHWWMDEWAL